MTTQNRTSGQTTTQVPCAFCQGAGKDPFHLLSDHALCGVCGGSGRVTVVKPTHRCAFCRGTGAFPGSRMTCTCCLGKGVVTVKGPADICPACQGAGSPLGRALPCSVCGGKGLVPVSRPGHKSLEGAK